MPKTSRLAWGSLVVGITGFGLKFAAYGLTGSIALYSDALESIINILVALVLIVSVKISEKPADETHHFGHHKIEYFSAVFEGVFIFLAAGAIFREAYRGFLHPIYFSSMTQAVLLNGAAGILNFLWAFYLVKEGKTLRSHALVADGKHLMTDVLTSVGTVIGVCIASLTGWTILDPLIACMLGIGVLWTGWGIIKESVNGLMDAAPDEDALRQIRTCIAENSRGALDTHDLKARVAGKTFFIEFHLTVSGQMSVSESHRICDQLEHALETLLGHSIVTIHVEPAR